MTTTITVTIPPEDETFLQEFLRAEDTRETQEELMSRLALKSLAAQIEALREKTQLRNGVYVVQAFQALTATQRARVLVALGLTEVDGRVVDPTPIPLIGDTV